MVFIYDGTYEGLLTCIFTVFNERTTPTAITPEGIYQPSLLDITQRIATSEDSAARVLKGVDERSQSRASFLMYKIFLSELPSCEMLIYGLVRAIIRQGNSAILENFANPHILTAAQIDKMINREVHRMHAFVRFQKSEDGLFCAAIDPDFNVLPLIGDHFERRYADQSWLIFDTRRHYGLYYDQEKMEFVGPDNAVLERTVRLLQTNELQDEKEKQYQTLWKHYFKSVNINERNNAKLHLRHMPRRYWKYLIEKDLFDS
jgi:probable DNA metabolism protein